MAKSKDKKHYSTHPMGHVWKRDEDGSIDIFAFGGGHHNGPACLLCDYGFCHHCRDMPTQKCTVVGKQRAALIKALRTKLVP